VDTSSALSVARVGRFAHVRRPTSAMRILVQGLLLSAIGLGLLSYHGLSLHLTPWSQAIVNAIVSHVYPHTGQNGTAVVLFREENLAQLEAPYPVPYERHAEILEALASYRPAAVFIDFAFMDPRPIDDVKRLGRAICHLRDSRRHETKPVTVAVFLAAPPPPDTPSPGSAAGGHDLAPELLACATPVSAQMDVERGVSGVLTYAACRSAERAEDCHRDDMPSAAFAMHHALFPSGERALTRPHHAEAMEVIWANGYSDINEKWMNCRRPLAFRDFLLMMRDNPLASKRPCPYTHTVSVMHLLGPVDDDVTRAIADRAVFYGASFVMAGDRVISPVYDDLPGVYLHAMAYDNLRSYGFDYKRAEQHPASRIANVILLVFTVFLLLVADEPLGPARHLFGPGVVRAERAMYVKIAAIALAIVSVVLTTIARPRYPALYLLPALLFGMLAFLHVVATRPLESRVQPIAAPVRFLNRGLLGAGVVAIVIAAFLTTDTLAGVENALLFVLLPGYFAYKAVVVRDWLFVVTTVLMICAAVVCYLPPFNLGPRNIVGYVAFFEVARHLIKEANHVAEKYLALRTSYRQPEEWGAWARLVPIADRIFTFLLRGDDKETIDEGTAHPVAA
jgi:CHASE2 domain-containing sensor protein